MDQGKRSNGSKVTRVGKYQLFEKLGTGAYAEVRLGRNVQTGQKVAVKIFDRNSLDPEDYDSELKNEISIMQYLRHRHVVRVEEVISENDSTYLLMELVTKGELFYEIVREKKLSESTSRRYFQQLVDAMCYCHRRGVCHRDLKPENLLLDEENNIKVTDFGMGKLKESMEKKDFLMRTQCGTPKYMAPEVIVRPKGGYDGYKADVWSTGIVLFALCSGYLPFNGESEKEIFRSIVCGELKFPDHFSSGMIDLLQRILKKSPQERLSMEEIRMHPWFLVNYEGDLVLEKHLRDSDRTVSSLRTKSAKRIAAKSKMRRMGGIASVNRDVYKTDNSDSDDESPVSSVDSDSAKGKAALKKKSERLRRKNSWSSSDDGSEDEVIAKKPVKGAGTSKSPPTCNLRTPRGSEILRNEAVQLRNLANDESKPRDGRSTVTKTPKRGSENVPPIHKSDKPKPIDPSSSCTKIMSGDDDESNAGPRRRASDVMSMHKTVSQPCSPVKPRSIPVSPQNSHSDTVKLLQRMEPTNPTPTNRADMAKRHSDVFTSDSHVEHSGNVVRRSSVPVKPKPHGPRSPGTKGTPTSSTHRLGTKDFSPLSNSGASTVADGEEVTPNRKNKKNKRMTLPNRLKMSSVASDIETTKDDGENDDANVLLSPRTWVKAFAASPSNQTPMRAKILDDLFSPRKSTQPEPEPEKKMIRGAAVKKITNFWNKKKELI